MHRILRFIPILLLLAVSGLSYGQSKMRFSVHADPQFAWLGSSNDDAIDPDGSIFHMQAGLQMDYFFEENYAFILGFGINNLGGNLMYGDSAYYVSGSGSNTDTLWAAPGQRMKMNLQYLDIPLGLKLKTEELGYATFFLQLGFNPMFNINAKLSSKDTDYDKEDIKESIKLFSLGYHVGAGVEYRLGGNTAVIGGIRWSSGLTNVSENDGSSLTTNAISINLGLLF